LLVRSLALMLPLCRQLEHSASARPEQRRKRPVLTDRLVLRPPTAQATMHHLMGALLSSRRD